MAEQNNDIQYLNYGDNQRVAQSDFMEKAANEVNNYVNSRPWSNKKKQKFMEAYSNIMSYGVSGASVKNGQWVVDINTNFDINTLPEADQKMYKEAAYFIQQQMSGMASDVEQKKEGTKPFDNTTFIEGLHKHIKNKMFGGRDWNIGGPDDDWNKLDPRDSKGVRGREKRAKTLANYLSSYADTIDENTYSFEDSPFKDYKDFKARIQNAITALRTDTIDDDESALNQLGLRASNYFNNGTGDPFEQGDYSGTYGDYYNRYLPEQLKKRQELEGQKEKALQKALEQKKQAVGQNYTMTTRVGPGALPTTRQLADKYGSTEGLLNQITEYGNRGLDKLTPEETKELVAAFRYGATASLTDDEFNLLKTSPSYKGASKSRFRKFPNISNLFLDTATGQVINIYDQATKDARGADFLAGQGSADLQNVPRGEGSTLTAADYRDIGATLADLAALVSPGIVTGTAASLAAAGARTWNRVAEKGLWDGIMNWDNALDWGTSILGGTPLWGDATSFAKFARGFGKLMTIPAVINAFASVPEAKAAWDKIDSNNLVESLKKLTPSDYHAMASVLTGVIGGRNYTRSNLAEREVIKHSGYTKEQINASKSKARQYAEKYGLLRTRVPGENTSVPTIKVKINDGAESEIKINQKIKDKINKEVSKAGNNEAKRNEAVTKVLKDEKLIKDTDKVTVSAPGKLDSKWNPTRNYTGSNRNLFGTNTESTIRQQGDFDEWLKTRSNWNRWRLGSDKNLIQIQRNLGLNSTIAQPLASSQAAQTPETVAPSSSTTGIPKTTNPNIHGIEYNGKIDEKVLKELNNAFNPSNKKLRGASRVINPKNSSANGKLIDGSDYQVKFGKDSSGKDEMLLIINGNSQKVEGNSLNEMKQNLGKMIREQNVNLQKNNKIILNTNDPKWQDFVKSIKDLKRKGYLFSHGGRIDRQKMQQYKEFMKR